MPTSLVLGGLARRCPRASMPRGLCASAGSLLRPIPQTMRHATYSPGCSAHEIGVGECAVPPVGAGDVLIQVAFSGVGGTDFAQRKGNFNPKPGSPPHHLIMGLEVSGLVAQVGSAVTAYKPGDRVAALLYGGGYAEYAVAPQEQVLELPSGTLSLAEGAAVPENFWTVWANLFEPAFGNLLERPREKTLLVHGGAGGASSASASSIFFMIVLADRIRPTRSASGGRTTRCLGMCPTHTTLLNSRTPRLLQQLGNGQTSITIL